MQLGASGIATSIEYTLPGRMNCLLLPAALLQRLPPGTGVPPTLSLVMDQLPHEPPVPVNYTRRRTNCLRIDVSFVSGK